MTYSRDISHQKQLPIQNHHCKYTTVIAFSPVIASPYYVIASAAKQSPANTTQCPTLDCHVAALLAMTEPCGLLRYYTSRKVNLRHCERSEAISCKHNTMPYPGLPRRCAPRNDGALWVATLLHFSQ